MGDFSEHKREVGLIEDRVGGVDVDAQIFKCVCTPMIFKVMLELIQGDFNG